MQQYLNLLKHILDTGSDNRKNRTIVDTISTFGYQNRYDISEYFPLLTIDVFSSIVKSRILSS